MLHIDFETRSELELGGKNSVGIHNYATHPSTKALMMAYAFGEEEPEVWFPDEGPMPERIMKYIASGDSIAAWNSNFERYILTYVCNIFVPIAQFQDPQASARYLSLPSTLADVGLILNLRALVLHIRRGCGLAEFVLQRGVGEIALIQSLLKLLAGRGVSELPLR